MPASIESGWACTVVERTYTIYPLRTGQRPGGATGRCSRFSALLGLAIAWSDCLGSLAPGASGQRVPEYDRAGRAASLCTRTTSIKVNGPAPRQARGTGPAGPPGCGEPG